MVRNEHLTSRCNKGRSGAAVRLSRLVRRLVIVSMMAICGRSSDAATITVTSTSGGTGGPSCTLRDAITAANTDVAAGGCAAGSGADSIELTAGSTYTLTVADQTSVNGDSGLPWISGDLTINGHGAIIERSSAAGTPSFRLFQVVYGANLTLRDLTVRNGDVSASGNAGGCIYKQSVGQLLLVNTVLTNCRAYDGGAIYQFVTGLVSLSGSQVTGNVAQHAGGGLANLARSGATAIPTLQLADSTVSGNSANVGGGICNTAGLGFPGSGDAAAVVVDRSTISGNTAASGGGIANLGGQGTDVSGGDPHDGGGATLTVTNSTLSGNSATGGSGGAIDNAGGDGDDPYGYGPGNGGPATTSLYNATLNANSASVSGGGVWNANGVGYSDALGGNAAMNWHNSILAGSPSGGNCAGNGITVADDYNLDSGLSCSFSGHDQRNTNPQLGPLRANWGATKTHALLPGSPAIDAGNPAGCLDGTATALSVDQRRNVRPLNGGTGTVRCDIGAFELRLPGTDLDLTFGTNGVVTSPVGPPLGSLSATAVIRQSDGKILAAGYGGRPGPSGDFGDIDFILVRYAADGSVDTAFGNNGMVKTALGPYENYVAALLQQTDGKLVAAGYANGDIAYSQFALARYNLDGSLDATFGSGGKVMTPVSTGSSHAYAVVQQPDGKLVAAGDDWSHGLMALARYNTDGSLDASFGTAGIVTTAITAVYDRAQAIVCQPDGKLVTAGYTWNGNTAYDFVLVRYNANGSLDTTFGTNGRVVTDVLGGGTDYARGMVLQSDGKLVVAGSRATSNESDFVMARYYPNGTLERTTLTPLSSSSNYATAVVLQSDGKLVAAGSARINGVDNLALVRYQPDLSLDTTFANAGKLITNVAGPASALARQPDGKLVTAGGPGFAVSRITSYGTLDTTFDGDGTLTTTRSWSDAPVTLRCSKPTARSPSQAMRGSILLTRRWLWPVTMPMARPTPVSVPTGR